MKSKLLNAKVVSLVFWTYMKTVITKFLVVPFPWKLRCWILCFYLIKVFHSAHPNKSPLGVSFASKTLICNCGFMIFSSPIEIKRIIDVHLTLVLAISSSFLDQIMFSIKIVSPFGKSFLKDLSMKYVPNWNQIYLTNYQESIHEKKHLTSPF